MKYKCTCRFLIPLWSSFRYSLQPQLIQCVAEIFTPWDRVFVNGPRPANTLQCNLQHEKRQFHSYQSCDIVVLLPRLLRKFLRQSFMEDLAFLAHHTFYWEYEWCECAMLYFHNSGIVLAFLFLFMSFKNRRNVFINLTIRVCVRDAHIEKGILRFSPESFRSNV